MLIDELPLGTQFGPVAIEVEGVLAHVEGAVEVEFPRQGAGARLLLVSAGRPYPVLTVGPEIEACRRLAAGRVTSVAWARTISEFQAVVEGRVYDSLLDLGAVRIEVLEDAASALCNWLEVDDVADPNVADEFFVTDPSGLQRVVIAEDSSSDGIYLVGRTCRLQVTTMRGVQATRFVPSIAPTGREQHVLAIGTLSFSTADPSDSSQLAALESRRSPVFELWHAYSELERELEQLRLRTVGNGRHGAPRFEGSLIVLPVNDPSHEQFLIELSEEREGTEIEIVPATQSPNSEVRALDRFVGNLVDVDVAARTVTVQRRPDRPDFVSNDGWISLSHAGATVQADRRHAVFERLVRGDCAVAALPYLLRLDPPPRQPRQPHKTAITDEVRRVMPGEPTAAQRRAIDIAINTPDIAMIQGPPGTGKSQVIAAVQQRLAELHQDGAARLILLTSVQHDAVDLVAARTDVFGLPARRVAARDREAIDPIAKWRQERIEALRQFREDREVPELLNRLDGLLRAFENTPYTPGEAATQLRNVADDCRGALSTQTVEALLTRAMQLERLTNRSRRDSDIRAVRRLRITPEGHADDGQFVAQRLIRRGIKGLSDWELRFRPLISQLSDGADVDLREVAQARDAMLDELLRAYVLSGVALADVETTHLLASAIAELRGGRVNGMTVEEAIEIYLRDLELYEDAADEAVARYTAVWASTCQGSAGLFLKDLREHRSLLAFPTVIVDEAARANPLDLLIPMIQAGERIILVGDHRQLPQLIDEGVRRRLGEDTTAHDTDLLDQCLFEQLFQHLGRLELETGIQRCVTLDVQFRMHPVLGALISSVFYEPYGERVTSGRPAEHFDHGIPQFAGQVAAWIDVPAPEGRAEKSGTSFIRAAEAERVAALVHELLTTAQGLSIGVITFYSAQRDLIRQKLVRFGVTEVVGGKLTISDRYKTYVNDSGSVDERLRIGTVDSFQGKEFDVVILSLVRSGTASNAVPAPQVFGFLTSENRMCVALSRQRRLLVMVGDRAMADLPQAAAVSGLREVAALCGERL